MGVSRQLLAGNALQFTSHVSGWFGYQYGIEWPGELPNRLNGSIHGPAVEVGLWQGWKEALSRTINLGSKIDCACKADGQQSLPLMCIGLGNGIFSLWRRNLGKTDRFS